MDLTCSLHAQLQSLERARRSSLREFGVDIKHNHRSISRENCAVVVEGRIRPGETCEVKQRPAIQRKRPETWRDIRAK